MREYFLHNFIVDVQCAFKAPIYPLDEIEIETELCELNEKTLKLTYCVRNKDNGKEIAIGYTVSIFVDENKKSIKAPLWFLNKIKSQV